MGLLRLLLIFLAIGIIIVLFRRLRAPKAQDQQPAHYDAMVRCAHCGINVPRDHAIRSRDGHYYCSIEHRDANQQ